MPKFVAGGVTSSLRRSSANRLRFARGRLGFCVSYAGVNMAMVKSDQPFAGISEMMTQNFEQARKAMEKYAELFGTGMKASPWFDADLNRKMQSYVEKNMAAANEFLQKLSETKEVPFFSLLSH